MGKRSDYERVERDFYPTPWQAVEPLVSHLPEEFAFAEPCGGDGALVNHIETLIEGAWCSWVSDIEPQKKGIHTKHFRDLSEHEFLEADYIITNPPWDRKLLHPMIEYFGEEVGRYEWNKKRKLPEWAERIFSEHMVAAGNVSDESELKQIFAL